MATLRDIHRRIKAVKNTQQITKAMKMVAAAKLRKVQDNMIAMRPYADKMHSVISSLAATAGEDAHPLLAQRPRKVAEVVVITSDKGLCGAFNTNILRAASRQIGCLSGEDCDESISAENLDVNVSVVGKKAVDYFRRRKVALRTKWTGISGALSFDDAKTIADEIINNYVEGNVDEVHLVYNKFINIVKQEVQAVKLLPTTTEAEPDEAYTGLTSDYIFEPDREHLLEALLPKNVEIQVYRALLESMASEEAARMTAMENATKAASEMIDTLTLQYNKARQASITAELMDIVGGVEALKD
jgi:F-type H+-transporting ATPase subunit gamma